MSVLPIKIYGDPVLRQPAREVKREDLTEDFQQWLGDMEETMYDASGIGLAANQVGALRRVFLADWAQVTDSPRRGKRSKEPGQRELHVFINPEIVESSVEDDIGNEGCLSIPEIEGDVYRSKQIRVRYMTPEGEEEEMALEGLAARVFQHELDHLNGILFIDHLPEEERSRLAGPLRQLRRKSREERAALSR